MKKSKIVIKLGTKILTTAQGQFSFENLNQLILQIIGLKKEFTDIIIVTSGAIGMGQLSLGLDSPLTMEEKQACAAVGQSLLMTYYNQIFNQHQLKTAQILITHQDLADRKRFINLNRTIERLLHMGLIPIINENDVVNTEEIKEGQQKSFGDNDKLSAILAAKLAADTLVLLTDVEQVYTENPLNNPEAEKITLIENIEDIGRITTFGKSTLGRGGMKSKLDAARLAALSGVNVVITSGFIANALSQIFPLDRSDRIGTLVKGQVKVTNREHWIGYSSGYEGLLIIDYGAEKALVEKNSSLLAVGIKSVQGEFSKGQIVSLQNENLSEVGRGLSNFSSLELTQKQPQVFAKEVIHKNNLVLFVEPEFDEGDET